MGQSTMLDNSRSIVENAQVKTQSRKTSGVFLQVIFGAVVNYRMKCHRHRKTSGGFLQVRIGAVVNYRMKCYRHRKTSGVSLQVILGGLYA